jgi:hypothetical protein
MARKTTALMDKQVKRHNETTKHISSILAAKSRGESDSHPEYSSEYFLGLIEGHNQALEQALMDANCYHGFGYVTSTMLLTTPEGKDFAEWRRVYYTK